MSIKEKDLRPRRHMCIKGKVKFTYSKSANIEEVLLCVKIVAIIYTDLVSVFNSHGSQRDPCHGISQNH